MPTVPDATFSVRTSEAYAAAMPVWVDAVILDAFVPEIGANAFLIYLHLKRRLGVAGLSCPSMRTLAEATGLSKTTVNTCVKKLEAVKLISIHQRIAVDSKYPHNEYTLLTPDVSNLKTVPIFGTEMTPSHDPIPVSKFDTESLRVTNPYNTIHESINKLIDSVAPPEAVTTNPSLGASVDDKQEAQEPQAATEPVQSSLLPIVPVTVKKPRPKKPTTPKPFWPIVEAVTTALFGLDAPSGRVFSFVLGETRQRIKMGFIEAYTGHKPEDITFDAANDIAELIRDAAKFTRNEDHLAPPLTPEGLGALILRYKDSQSYRVKQDRKAWDAMQATLQEASFA